MKKIICMVLAIMVAISMGASASALEDQQTNLSEMTDGECIAFIKENGVIIPQEYDSEQDCVEFVRVIIRQVEENPSIVFAFGYRFLTEFANQIKTIVNDYYGISEIAPCSFVGSMDNILQDNIVLGTWKSEYEDYNCYAYAIGYDTWIHPGQIEWMSEGNDYETYFYNLYANIHTIAGWVQDDLESMGYTVYTPTTTMPNTEASIHSNLICVRKDEDVSLDFHLMVLKKDGAWCHKPGGTNPLKYRYSPASTGAWTQEGYDGVLYFRDDDVTYDSAIYYIKYTTPHEYEYEPCSSNQHILTCTICGETSGNAMLCRYDNDICRICGGSKPIDLTTRKYGGVILEE